jgi:hypothetical protein
MPGPSPVKLHLNAYSTQLYAGCSSVLILSKYYAIWAKLVRRNMKIFYFLNEDIKNVRFRVGANGSL